MVPQQQVDPGTLPGPVDASEIRRWEYTRWRRRIFYSGHRADVQAAIKEHVGTTRAKVWGTPDMSANPTLALSELRSRMYAEAPAVAGMADTVEAATAAGLWSLMQRVQRDASGLREMAVGVEVIDGRPVYTPMFPDLLEGRAAPGDPGQPVVLTHTREHPGLGWVRVTWDIEGQIYEARDLDGTDVSRQVLGGVFRGPAYPFRDAAGAAIMPVVLYHAAETSTLWDAYSGAELFEGGILLNIYLTYYGHVLKNCGFSQRYAGGVEVDGVELDLSQGGSTSTREITPDPAAVLMFRPTEDGGGQPVIGQWAPPVSPKELIESIGIYWDRMVSAAGLKSDVTRTSSDIRSGYSLAVERESVREAQRVDEPLYARSDERLLTVTAQLLGHPVEPVQITYRGLPVSPQERRALVQEVRELRAERLMTRVEAWLRLHAAASDEDARRALAAIDAETAPKLLVGHVAAASGIVSEVAAGSLSKAAGVQMLIELIGLPPAAAQAIMAPVVVVPRSTT